MSGAPDPKPTFARIRPSHKIRIVNPAAVVAKVLAERECRVCGKPASNGDHIIQKGAPHYGDDVEENVVPLCGTGTSGCHGKKHDRDPETMLIYGERLKPDEIEYVRSKLGQEEGDAWLFNTFRLMVPLPEESDVG